jgi:hypothetical protein
VPPPPALSAFAAIGLAIALAYLLCSTLWSGVVLVARTRREWASGLQRRPGAFVAAELAQVERRLRRHATAALLFSVTTGVLSLFGRHEGWSLPGEWVPRLLAVLVGGTALFAILKGYALIGYRRRLAAVLAADLAVAQRLEEVQRRGHRMFHAVQIGPHLVDHVVVGTIGVFAVQVIVPERSGATGVSMSRGSLVFGPGHGQFRLQPTLETFSRLARELGRLVGHPIKVVPTLVVPGCRISTWDDDRCLLTNEQNCVTLVGWKDSAAYLMDDEVARICEWLAPRCRPRRWPLRPARGALHACATRPALL